MVVVVVVVVNVPGGLVVVVVANVPGGLAFVQDVLYEKVHATQLGSLPGCGRPVHSR